MQKAKSAKKYFRPYGKAVLVRPVTQDEKVGSLFRPESAKEPTFRSEVLALGTGLDSPGFAPGDVLIHGKYAGTEIPHDGEKLTVLQESDILGVE